MQKTPAIQAKDLSVGYRRKAILEHLYFSLMPGQIVALVGKNGVGKSTLIRTLTSELPPISGQVTLAGKPLPSWTRRQLASMVAVVTTDPLQVGALTVRELVSLGRDPHTGPLGRLGDEDRAAVDRAMQQVGIDYKRDEYVACLSDGERQKALIARALAQDTQVIILDEPFSFLDVSARIEILRLVADLCHSSGRAILFSSHDIAQALRMTDMIWMLTPDRRFITGTPQEIISHGDINRLFDTPGITFDPMQNDFISSPK